jgi:hypothetical protein
VTSTTGAFINHIQVKIGIAERKSDNRLAEDVHESTAGQMRGYLTRDKAVVNNSARSAKIKQRKKNKVHKLDRKAVNGLRNKL